MPCMGKVSSAAGCWEQKGNTGAVFTGRAEEGCDCWKAWPSNHMCSLEHIWPSGNGRSGQSGKHAALPYQTCDSAHSFIATAIA